jgi:carbon storage regulator CsrA
MLVLCRRKNESVMLGDEVTVTVEEICDGDGRRLFGASLQLGFQSPGYVSICRSELRAQGDCIVHKSSKPKTTQPRPGRRVEISDAVVRLRIHVPQKIPVCCNGTPTMRSDLHESLDGEGHMSTAEHQVTCHKEDRITICNNITVAVLNFHRFVFSDSSKSGATAPPSQT